MAVLFHGSFGLHRERMAGMMKAALKDSKIDDKTLAKPFGYGAPFSSRYRSWLHKTGLCEMGLPLKLTEMGEVVWKNDPKFATKATQIFLHHELTTEPERAESWHYFAKEYLPNVKQFTRADLEAGLVEKLRYHSEQHFGPGGSLVPVIARKIVECYTSDFALGG